MKDGILSHLEDSDMDLTDFEEFDDDIEDIDASANDKKDDNDDSLLYSIYIFDSLSQVIDVSRLIAPTFKGDGVRENPTYAKELFYMEHFDEILANKAIETLGAL